MNRRDFLSHTSQSTVGLSIAAALAVSESSAKAAPNDRIVVCVAGVRGRGNNLLHPSSMLCHLGNVAWRLGRSVKFDPQTYTFSGDDEANKLLTRPEYRKPWVLPEIAKL